MKKLIMVLTFLIGFFLTGYSPITINKDTISIQNTIEEFSEGILTGSRSQIASGLMDIVTINWYSSITETFTKEDVRCFWLGFNLSEFDISTRSIAVSGSEAVADLHIYGQGRGDGIALHLGKLEDSWLIHSMELTGYLADVVRVGQALRVFADGTDGFDVFRLQEVFGDIVSYDIASETGEKYLSIRLSQELVILRWLNFVAKVQPPEERILMISREGPTIHEESSIAKLTLVTVPRNATSLGRYPIDVYFEKHNSEWFITAIVLYDENNSLREAFGNKGLLQPLSTVAGPPP